jgi:hypothetical protein
MTLSTVLLALLAAMPMMAAQAGQSTCGVMNKPTCTGMRSHSSALACRIVLLCALRAPVAFQQHPERHGFEFL